MSRIVFAGTKHPAQWRKEIVRRLDDLLPELVELLKETEMFRLSLYVCADGRVEIRIDDVHGRTELKDRADTHHECRVHLDHERIFG